MPWTLQASAGSTHREKQIYFGCVWWTRAQLNSFFLAARCYAVHRENQINNNHYTVSYYCFFQFAPPPHCYTPLPEDIRSTHSDIFKGFIWGVGVDQLESILFMLMVEFLQSRHTCWSKLQCLKLPCDKRAHTFTRSHTGAPTSTCTNI